MPQPASQSVHVDQVLTNISVAYLQGQEGFVADRVFPTIPVAHKSDKYLIYTKNDWFRDEAQLRSSGAESVGSGYNISDTTYSADRYAIHKDIPDDVATNADDGIDLERDATQFVTQRLMLRREIKWASDAFASSVWGTDLTPSNLWSDFATSDPLGDVAVGKRTVLSTTGFLPNTWVLGYEVWEKLEHHPDIVDRIKYTSNGVVTEATLAGLFGINRILIATAIKATNLEGETAAYSFVNGKHALLAYVNPAPSRLAPSAGYTFSWRGVSGGLGADIAIKSFRMEHLEVQRVEGAIALDNKIVAADLGYFFSSVVA